MELWINGKSKREWGVGSVEEGRENFVKLKKMFQSRGCTGLEIGPVVP